MTELAISRLLRVAFTGASGTGKSTLTEWASQEFALPINPIGSRSVSQTMGFLSPYDVDAAGKRGEFQRRLLSEKAAWERDMGSFVTDRSVLDNLAYTILHDVHSIDGKTLDDVRVALRRYTHVVFCPIDAVFKPGSDPARVMSKTYHEVFEQVLHGMLSSSGIDEELHVLGSPDLEERKAYLRGVFAHGRAPSSPPPTSEPDEKEPTTGVREVP
jgi:hypothetical protein